MGVGERSVAVQFSSVLQISMPEPVNSHIDIGIASCVLIAIMLTLGNPTKDPFRHVMHWRAYVDSIA